MSNNGFSLIEILVALCLITSTCLILIKQQWQTMQWTNQQLLHWQANHHLNNACERQKAGLPFQSLPPPFHWYPSTDIHIKWQIQQQIINRHFDCSHPKG